MKCKYCSSLIELSEKYWMAMTTATRICQKSPDYNHEPAEPTAAVLEINIEQGNISANSGSAWPTCESRPAAPTTLQPVVISTVFKAPAVKPQKVELCRNCQHPADSHDDEFGNCGHLGLTVTGHDICKCSGYEEPEAGSMRPEMPPKLSPAEWNLFHKLWTKAACCVGRWMVC